MVILKTSSVLVLALQRFNSNPLQEQGGYYPLEMEVRRGTDRLGRRLFLEQDKEFLDSGEGTEVGGGLQQVCTAL